MMKPTRRGKLGNHGKSKVKQPLKQDERMEDVNGDEETMPDIESVVIDESRKEHVGGGDDDDNYEDQDIVGTNKSNNATKSADDDEFLECNSAPLFHSTC